jgi:endonuclease-8
MMSYPDPTKSIAEVMLDQHVVCGVGNVYRCEVLWACEVHPHAAVGTLPQSACVELVRTAAEMLQANLHHTARVTTVGTPGGLAVYGRNNQRCERCQGIIAIEQHGQPPRLLYWCPECQTRCQPAPKRDDSNPLARMTDPHPAGSQFVANLIDEYGRFSDVDELEAS